MIIMVAFVFIFRFASSQSSLRAKASAASSMTVAGSVTSRGGRMSTLSNALSQSNSSDFFTGKQLTYWVKQVEQLTITAVQLRL